MKTPEQIKLRIAKIKKSNRAQHDIIKEVLWDIVEYIESYDDGDIVEEVPDEFAELLKGA